MCLRRNWDCRMVWGLRVCLPRKQKNFETGRAIPRCKAERLGLDAVVAVRGSRAAVRRGAVRLKLWEDEQPGPCPGLGSTIGEGFLIAAVTGELGLRVLERPGLRHWRFWPRGRGQCDDAVQGRRIPSSATEFGQRDRKEKRG